jgi:anti-sigma B factor antagonist
LEIETRRQDGIEIVKLTGRLCMGPPLDRFNATLGELLRQSHNKIILDLEAMPTVDSTGIGMLVRYLTTAKQSGGNIRLLHPSKFTVQTLKMVGILNLFSVYEDLSQAVAAFQ